ncbi:unnamed protein product [Trichogramma brassicae]|uniref:BMP and activin membrane-bound inhibitor N-terminal domain-containing protein n=1 Tax=Trichogramma brassicae TaxID=86971 RepID=A0A6H5I735_9HYME|nr:unnamed protein product [Trichogramma brassicae]
MPDTNSQARVPLPSDDRDQSAFYIQVEESRPMLHTELYTRKKCNIPEMCVHKSRHAAHWSRARPTQKRANYKPTSREGRSRESKAQEGKSSSSSSSRRRRRSEDNNSASSQDLSSSPGKSNQQQHEVRCYCNQPHCVSQGYMCRGRGCFTELPPLALVASSLKSLHLLHGRPETAGFSGCFDDKLNSGGGNNVNGKISCPPGKLCCEQDLCNHVDSPALRARLNKTLQGETEREFFSLLPLREDKKKAHLDDALDSYLARAVDTRCAHYYLHIPRARSLIKRI